MLSVWFSHKNTLILQNITIKHNKLMKRIVLSVMFALCGLLSPMAQSVYNVSTSIQKKNVLLEEFTGIHCGWCPEGHKVATQLVNAIPDGAYVVAVHTGYYSVPAGNEPDYRTDMGEYINKMFNIDNAGFPSGMINRDDFGRGIAVSGRDRWTNDALLIKKQDAPVNLYIKSKYNGLTSTINIHVEGYYTAEPDAPAEQYLNVILTQDNIVGPQNGGSAGDEYTHNHMLRDNISPLEGTKIDNAGKGNYFTFDYSYQLPENIKGIKVMPEDINIIAYVVDKVKISNAAGGKPEYSNYNETEAGAISAPLMPVGTRYGYNFFEAFLKNKSSQTITNATFDVTVNGTTTPATIDCNIDQFATEPVRVPATLTFADKGYTKYEIRLTHLNGVQVDGGGSLTGNIQKPLLTGTEVTAQIMTDDHASQNTFILYDAEGNKIKEFGPYPEWTAATYYETAELEDGKTYCLEVFDTYGDGMLDGGKGGLITRTGWGKLIDQYYTVTGYGTRSFFKCDPAGTAAAINELNANGKNAKTIHSVDGRKTATPTANGIYIVKDYKGVRKEIINNK